VYPLAVAIPQARALRLPLSRDQLMLLMAAVNEVFLGVDIYLAHSISGTITAREWIPIVFGPCAGIVLLLAGLIALRRRPAATILATTVFVLSIGVGLLGAYYHFVRAILPNAPVGERVSIDLLVWAPPLLGPLTFALVGVLGASLVPKFGGGVGVAVTILLATGLGFLNGVFVTKLKIPAFITTLGMMSIARGLTYLLSTGLQGSVASNIPMRNEQVNFLGAGYIGKVPFPVIEMVVLVTIFSLFLKHVVLGRQIYAVGSNEQAAHLSGVNVANVRLFVYTLLGGLAALSGVMNAGLLSTAPTNLGTGNELDVIAAVVIGGASLAGGEGTILGAVIGAAIMAVIRNAFVLLKLPIYMQTVTIGVVIIIAVALDQLRKRGS